MDIKFDDFYLAYGVAFVYAKKHGIVHSIHLTRRKHMKTQQKPAYRQQRNWQRRGAQHAPSLSRYQRITKSWVVNTLLIPTLLTLLSAALTLLLTHWGK